MSERVRVAHLCVNVFMKLLCRSCVCHLIHLFEMCVKPTFQGDQLIINRDIKCHVFSQAAKKLLPNCFCHTTYSDLLFYSFCFILFNERKMSCTHLAAGLWSFDIRLIFHQHNPVIDLQ